MPKTAERRVRGADRLLFALASLPVLHVLLIAALFWVVFIAIAVLVPLGSGPDESVHYMYSAAVVRGQSGTLDVDIPAAVANIRQYTCIAFQPELTAKCQEMLTGANPTVPAETYVGLYNPVFYFLAGLGTLISPDESGLYISRILSAAVAAGMLGWGVSLLLRRAGTTWPVVGLLLVLTPMVSYVSAVLNPSGWEITSALAATVAGYLLIVRPAPERRWTEAHSLLVLAGSVLLISRGLSVFIAALIFVALVIVAGWPATRDFLTRRATWIALALLAAVALASVAWILLHGTNYIGVKPPSSLIEGIESIPVYYQGVWSQVQQVFAVIGWFELMPPNVLVLLWQALLIAFVAVSYVLSRGRGQFVIALGALVVLLLPGILAGTQWGGVGWQGRYTLPFIVALVVIAGLAASDAILERETAATAAADAAGLAVVDPVPSPRTRATLLVAAFLVFAGAQIAMAVITAHRYLVGESAELFSPPTWQPPVNFRILLVVLGVAVLLVGWIMARTVQAGRRLVSER